MSDVRLLAAAPLFAVTIACGNTTRTVDLPTPAQTPSAVQSMPAGAASIEIVAPEPGEEITGQQATVRVRVRGFDLVERKEAEASRGQGHIVYYSGPPFGVPVVQDRPATSGGSGGFTSAPSSTTSYVWTNMTPGDWMFAAQLVGSDGAPLSPPRFATVRVTVPR